ncbi:MAG: phenylalanine--tRNA ligase subunit beta [Planctomycetota bacterium]|nr:phenylalanine--tRNA ligase subunit beta [Planctomycetota bacterium]
METSNLWINDYLDSPISPEEQADLLTQAGFPHEGSKSVENGEDVRQDFEMTSNRGDCVCHLGLAREIAALSKRRLKIPEAIPTPTGPPASESATLINEEPDLCPLYTARVIKGIKVGPSPEWLAKRLRARGDIPRNNVVDATNFVNFEWGQPTHVFDLDLLKKNTIIIRKAKVDERFLPLGEGETEIKLTRDDLVIADAENAVALAGVKGGGLTAVTEKTSDILIEAATFNPVSVRNTSRRHNIITDSSYRFERGVHPGQVNDAADRLVCLILELAGGELCEGVISEGKPIPDRRQISMRTDRCRKIMGVPIPDDTMVDALDRLGFDPRLEGERIECTVPIHRLDVEREIDIIEEVGRVFGHDNIPMKDAIEIRVAPPQPTIEARSAVSDVLVGMGFVESVTHTLVPEKHATLFLSPGTTPLRVDDDRAKAWPILQPSVLPSLLRVRASNHANGVERLKLFQGASTFWRTQEGHHESIRLGMVLDLENEHDGLRPVRGVIERIVRLLLGPDAQVDVRPDDSVPWFTPAAEVSAGGRVIGHMGVLPKKLVSQFELDMPLLGAELDLQEFYATYPPDKEAHRLPAFPAITRDVSAIVDESLAWNDLHRTLDVLNLDHLVAIEFVTVFRGKSIESGRKSLTFRLRFRADDRTLKHEEVDTQMDRVIETMHQTFSAEIRQ